MIRPSTFSIVAFDPQDQSWGVAVASKFLAVGNVVPWARAGVGAVATQSHANTSYGPRGLALMESGASASLALEKLLEDDPDRELRQAGMVDQQGRCATYTGKSCYPWAGGVAGQNYVAQGNILASEQVVVAMVDNFTKASGDLPHRLLAALIAGDQAGGDRRGKQSAAIFVVKAKSGYGGFNDRWVDYRVDDHPDPIQRLGELLELHELYFNKSVESDQLRIEGNVLFQLQSIMLRLGYFLDQPVGVYDEKTRASLEAFLGNENFEERVDIKNGIIDKPVYDYILHQFGTAR
jgi:uncharacterized Ntn-hydrolase superfamily protein